MHEWIEQAHKEWHPILYEALASVPLEYLEQLKQQNNWLPGHASIFAAFSKPLSSIKYVLLGESPYPRATSANGYAFWDAAVLQIWQDGGLSKEVNRATSLRNFIKMLLHARGDLTYDFSQEAIARIDKANLIDTGEGLFRSMMDKGFLLLNASLVYQNKYVPYHARQWKPFMSCLFQVLANINKSLTLVLLGKIAAQLPEARLFSSLIAEHPYNISFITNPDVLHFFKPMDILKSS